MHLSVRMSVHLSVCSFVLYVQCACVYSLRNNFQRSYILCAEKIFDCRVFREMVDSIMDAFVIEYYLIPADTMEILSIDFNNSLPLLSDINVLCCSVAPPSSSHDNHDDSECVVMVTVTNSGYTQVMETSHMF